MVVPLVVVLFHTVDVGSTYVSMRALVYDNFALDQRNDRVIFRSYDHGSEIIRMVMVRAGAHCFERLQPTTSVRTSIQTFINNLPDLHPQIFGPYKEC